MFLSRFSYLKDCSFYLELSLLQTTYLVRRKTSCQGKEDKSENCGDTHMGKEPKPPATAQLETEANKHMSELENRCHSRAVQLIHLPYGRQD